MTPTKARQSLGTSSADFQAKGSPSAFVNWLDGTRTTMSRERCRQLGFYARQLLDLLGSEVATLVVDDPEDVVARLREIDLQRHGATSAHRSHMNRAARALHAWLHDLGPEATAQVMDRMACPGRSPATSARSDGGGSTSGPAETVAVSAADAILAETATDVEDPDEATMDPALMAAEMPESYRFFEDSVCSQVSLAFHYEDTVPDIRAVGREILEQYSPGTRRLIALDLAGVRDLSLDMRELSHASLTDVCDEVILTMLERRGVEIRDVPLQAA